MELIKKRIHPFIETKRFVNNKQNNGNGKEYILSVIVNLKGFLPQDTEKILGNKALNGDNIYGIDDSGSTLRTQFAIHFQENSDGVNVFDERQKQTAKQYLKGIYNNILQYNASVESKASEPVKEKSADSINKSLNNSSEDLRRFLDKNHEMLSKKIKDLPTFNEILNYDNKQVDDLYHDIISVWDFDKSKHIETLMKKIKSYKKNLDKSSGDVAPKTITYAIYALPPLENLWGNIERRLEIEPSRKIYRDTQKSADELWLECLKHIGEERTNSLLKSLSFYQDIDNNAFGWRFSLYNVIRICSQYPNASYVATRRQWEKYFNRIVNDDATPIYLMKYHTDYKGGEERANDIKAAMQKRKYNDSVNYNDIKDYQMKRSIDVEVDNKKTQDMQVFITYDVSETTLMSGARDVFNEEPGFVNNITGELNDKAKESKDGVTGKGVKKDKLAQNNNGDANAINTYLEFGCNRKGVYEDILSKTSGIKDPTEKLIKRIETIAKKILVEKYNYNHEDVVKPLSILTVLFVCVLADVCSESVLKKYDKDMLNDNDYRKVRNVILEVIGYINLGMESGLRESKNHIKEGIGLIPTDLTIEDMKDMLGGDDSNELEHQNESRNLSVIKENFYKLFNKI